MFEDIPLSIKRMKKILKDIKKDIDLFSNSQSIYIKEKEKEYIRLAKELNKKYNELFIQLQQLID